MFLVEAERGCHRGCTYCVMRRSTNGGMRLASRERVLWRGFPPHARRVGLVGAAVTDHPELVAHPARAGRRGPRGGDFQPARRPLTDEIVGLLKRGGYRSLTTASDGASERLRDGDPAQDQGAASAARGRVLPAPTGCAT